MNTLKDPEIYKMRIIRDTVRHIISNYYQPDIVISLQANSPEIESIHIDSAIKKIIDENLFEIISVDEKLVQNGAFRVLRGPNILQKDLSTYCAAFICDIKDIHYESDLNLIGEKMEIIVDLFNQHSGNIRELKRLALSAFLSGADVVKTQIIDSKRMWGDNSRSYLEMDFFEVEEIAEYCDNIGVEFMTTVFNEEHIEWLDKLKVKKVQNSQYDLCAEISISLR